MKQKLFIILSGALAIVVINFGVYVSVAEMDGDAASFPPHQAGMSPTDVGRAGQNTSAPTTLDQTDDDDDNGPSFDDSDNTCKAVSSALRKDRWLSAPAHDIRVEKSGGKMITLSGTVANRHEETRVMSKASKIAGRGNVRNDLAVRNTK